VTCSGRKRKCTLVGIGCGGGKKTANDMAMVASKQWKKHGSMEEEKETNTCHEDRGGIDKG